MPVLLPGSARVSGNLSKACCLVLALKPGDTPSKLRSRRGKYGSSEKKIEYMYINQERKNNSNDDNDEDLASS